MPNSYVTVSINVGVNFNTALTQADTFVDVLYWGTYQTFCGVYYPYPYNKDPRSNDLVPVPLRGGRPPQLDEPRIPE
jgi:hypothetical protein